jgi:phage-related protein
VFDVELWDGRGYAAGGTAAIEVLADALKAAWAPVRAGTLPLTVEIASAARILNGRPIAMELDLDGALFGIGRALLTFEATDPRFYAASLSTLVLGLTVGGGMTFPLTFPLTFGAGSDSDGSAVNAGNTDAPWTATIVGPVTNPTITLGDTGEFIEIDGDIPTGSTLVIDSATQSILLNGSPRQSWQTLLSKWWALAPGTNTIRYRAASGSGSCTLNWRSAWL